MARVHNFSAGPAALPTSVLAEIADEMMDYRGCGMSVLEMSHRSSMYQQIIDDAEATLRRLLSIPDNYRVLFLQGGATLQFAGIPMNLMRRGRAGYIVTGNFASRVSLLFGIAGFLAFFGGEMFTTAKDAIVSYKRRKDWEKKINRK